jgi:XTP/dITP diphosphohydrolase
MKTIVFATNNAHKLTEVRAIVSRDIGLSGETRESDITDSPDMAFPSDEIKIVGLADVGCCDDIPETADTLEGNALQKATYIKTHYGYDCFADDTGLEVEALNGEPGVRSARYASDAHDSNANMDKLLRTLDGQNNRNACFRTVIVALIDGKEVFFEGVVNGRIIKEKRGKTGFGYDPIFVPDGYRETFAEMGADIKNRISHRSVATQKFTEWLKTIVVSPDS